MDQNAAHAASEHSAEEKIGGDFLERMEKIKSLKDEACANGNHGVHLTYWNRSGGMIHWKCTHCGKLISLADLPMTI